MIYPGAVWNPGVNAGYRAGRNTMTTAVAHYTVGRNSTGIGLRGYFHFLISRDGTVQQFCEADAVAWHAGDPWNGRGPGIEIEYLDEATIFTPAQHAACGALIAWLPIPHQFYDGPRLTAWDGYITHRSLVQSGDPHSDYWDQSDWDAMTAPPLLEGDRMNPRLYQDPTDTSGAVYVYDPNAHTKVWVQGPDALAAIQAAWSVASPPVDATIVSNETAGRILRDAVDLRVGGGVTSAGGALNVTLTGTATPA